MSGIANAEERMRGRAVSESGSVAAEDGVGCAALRTALVDLERALCRDRCHAVVSAPAGPAKRQLLEALAERLAGSLEVVIVEPSLLDDDEVCTRILDALQERPEVDPEMRLLSVLQGLGARGSALALLIDDAGWLPAATLRRLGRLAALSRPDLRLVLVVENEPEAGGASLTQVVGALGVSAEKVVLGSRPGEGDGPLPLLPAAPSGPPELQQSPDERAQEERALEAMRLHARPGPSRHLAAIALGLALVLLGANQIAFRAFDPLAPGAGPARESAAPSPAPLQVAAIPATPVPPRPPEVESAEEPAPAAVAEPEAPAPVSTAPSPRPEPATVSASPAAPAPKPLPAPKLASAQPAAPVVAPAARRVPVSVNARPWARIEVDGRDVGVTPLGSVPLEPGSHRFRAHLPDGRVVERTTDVDAHRDHVVFP